MTPQTMLCPLCKAPTVVEGQTTKFFVNAYDMLADAGDVLAKKAKAFGFEAERAFKTCDGDLDFARFKIQNLRDELIQAVKEFEAVRGGE